MHECVCGGICLQSLPPLSCSRLHNRQRRRPERRVRHRFIHQSLSQLLPPTLPPLAPLPPLAATTVRASDLYQLGLLIASYPLLPSSGSWRREEVWSGAAERRRKSLSPPVLQVCVFVCVCLAWLGNLASLSFSCYDLSISVIYGAMQGDRNAPAHTRTHTHTHIYLRPKWHSGNEKSNNIKTTVLKKFDINNIVTLVVLCTTSATTVLKQV